jgi:hypothetical protein
MQIGSSVSGGGEFAAFGEPNHRSMPDLGTPSPFSLSGRRGVPPRARRAAGLRLWP